ncbi:MAG: hypothetical protein J6C37_00850, partial [Roseburia sp.]|nr:hypothetical protein [Roseburia sp.]
MKQQISCKQFWDRLYQDCKRNTERYIIREDGAIYPKGPYHYMIGPDAACREAYVMAVAYHFSGDETLCQKAELFLDYAGKSLIQKDGYVYWPAPVATLCDMGRWAREAYRAAEILQYDPAIRWLETIFDCWPYRENEHRFVERFMEATHYPTSVNGFLTTYNMIAEGMADGWLVANKTGNQNLKDKVKDILCNFILPGQRGDGLWNYSAPKAEDMGYLNDGEKEYNYCLYLVYILSNLLECPDARPLLEEPLKKAVDELIRRFMHADGSIYTPVHWGWDHIYESTLLTSVVCWRLYHCCGYAQYSTVAARGIHWLMVTDMGVGNLSGGMSCVGLYWNALFLDMLKDDFSVEGELCTKAEVIHTLEKVEKILSIVPPDGTHRELYFSLGVYNTCYAIQRKIQRLKKENDDVLSIPMWPNHVRTDMPWQFEDTGYSGKMTISYDDEGLYVMVDCSGSMEKQPYTDASLYQGDGVILTLRDSKGNHALINLALQEGEPVAYLYNDALPFKGDLRLYVESEPQGWYLKNS